MVTVGGRGSVLELGCWDGFRSASVLLSSLVLVQSTRISRYCPSPFSSHPITCTPARHHHLRPTLLRHPRFLVSRLLRSFAVCQN
jgi:hypothetical protein